MGMKRSIILNWSQNRKYNTNLTNFFGGCTFNTSVIHRTAPDPDRQLKLIIIYLPVPCPPWAMTWRLFPLGWSAIAAQLSRAAAAAEADRLIASWPPHCLRVPGPANVPVQHPNVMESTLWEMGMLEKVIHGFTYIMKRKIPWNDEGKTVSQLITKFSVLLLSTCQIIKNLYIHIKRKNW
jgi:hypothetical protein